MEAGPVPRRQNQAEDASSGFVFSLLRGFTSQQNSPLALSIVDGDSLLIGQGQAATKS